MGGCGGEGERKEISASMNRVLRDDLLVEILHRVPCKSAFQCKSVCKKWRDLISSKYFLNRFDRHHRSDHEKKIQELGNFSVEYFFPHLFFNPSEYKHQISFDFLPFFNSLPEKTTHFIAGASNDLFLCTEDLQIQDQPVFYVCNPITKHSIALPPPPPRTVLDDISDAFLGSAVFGFSSYNTKFTVVRVLLPVTGKRELFEFQVDVFSSDTGKWARLIAASPKPLMWCSGTPAVYYRGLLHWVSVFGKQIVVYDVSKNSFSFIIAPPHNFFRDVAMLLALSSEVLYMCQLRYDNDSTLKMWKLNYLNNNEQPEWVFEGQFELEEFIRHGPSWMKDLRLYRVIAIHPYDHSILYLGGGVRRQHVVSCNLRTKTLKLAYESSNDYLCNTVYMMGLQLWPTLISPIP